MRSFFSLSFYVGFVAGFLSGGVLMMFLALVFGLTAVHQDPASTEGNRTTRYRKPPG
jgi:hypothetical protein